MYLVANGNPEQAGITQNNNGLLYAAYHLLEQLGNFKCNSSLIQTGFAFFHPLEPTIPPSLTFPTQSSTISENPYWPFRGNSLSISNSQPQDFTFTLNTL